MSNQSFLDKLQLESDKTILIQGLPSSIEKQFVKLSFSKNVTPLLKRKKIDFALIFAINNNQLCAILKDVFPALHTESKLWISFPKTSSKIVTDLNKSCTWDVLCEKGYGAGEELELDNVWKAILFSLPKAEEVSLEEDGELVLAEVDSDQSEGRKFEKKLSVLPTEINMLFKKHDKAREFFVSLPSINQKEYVTWIRGAKKEEVKERRLEEMLEKLLAGKTNPLEK
jgi:hypothetical protein